MIEPTMGNEVVHSNPNIMHGTRVFIGTACLVGLGVFFACSVSAQDLEPGEHFSDELRDGGRGPEMVVIPAGSFSMGCVSDLDCFGDSEQVHRVVMPRPFAVSKYEVTFEDYDRFTHPRRERIHGRGPWPIIWVNWIEAKEYVAWLSAQTGHPYRLLTEAEWEYAARAGTTTRFHFGDDPGQLCRYGNIGDKAGNFSWAPCSDGVGRQTSEAGRYAPNAFGLYDVHGNVWEWVEDCWNEDYSGAPTDGSAWLSGDCKYRILRGGSYNSGPRALRVSVRHRERTTVGMAHAGLRVARTLIP